MTARQAQEPLAVATFGEVECHRTLRFGSSHRRNTEPEGRGKRTDDVDEWVQVIDGWEEPWTNLPDVVRITELYFDVGESEVLEKGKEDHRQVASVRGGEPRFGKDPDPNDDRTDFPFFIIHPLEANGLYRRKEHLEITL